jgi:minor histocompatibility antigen H13
MANITAKATEALAQILEVYYDLFYKQDPRKMLDSLIQLLPAYLLAVTAALFPIFTGAWASLRRPSSAAKIPESEDSDDDDNELETVGFVPWDIVRIPLGAGTALTALYYAIKYLDDPQLLSKVISWLFSLSGITATTFLISDSLRIVHRLVFPTYYAYKGGIWFVDAAKRQARLTGSDESKASLKTSPLPGILSDIPLPMSLSNGLWSLRQLSVQKFVLKFSIHKVVADKTVVDVIDLLGVSTATAIILFWLLNSRPWYLTNVIGIAVSYFAVQQISPSSFWLASLVMAGLLVYDVVMVYYT